MTRPKDTFEIYDESKSHEENIKDQRDALIESICKDDNTMIDQTKINYTYNVLQILGVNLDAKQIETVISAHELISQKGGKASIEDIAKIQHDINKKYHVGKK